MLLSTLRYAGDARTDGQPLRTAAGAGEGPLAATRDLKQEPDAASGGGQLGPLGSKGRGRQGEGQVEISKVRGR